MNIQTTDHEVSSLEGKVTCGIWEDGRAAGAYSLSLDGTGAEISAADLSGVRYGFATLVQILRAHRSSLAPPDVSRTVKRKPDDGVVANGKMNGLSTSTSTAVGEADIRLLGSPLFTNFVAPLRYLQSGGVPALTVRDSPDSAFRAIYQDFSGCKILNSETVCVIILCNCLRSASSTCHAVELLQGKPPLCELRSSLHRPLPVAVH